METFWKSVQQFQALEDNFQLAHIIEWHSEHIDVPIFACCFYFIIVFWVPGVLADWGMKFQLKGAMIAWNAFLAIFSMLGASRTIPVLIRGFTTRGFEGSICDDGAWFWNGRCGFWVALFVYSKFPELIDTVFLVLRRREVIMLHWFHHCTVLLFCWHAYMHKSGPGIWFATMNYSVHAIMYSYYTAMAAKIGAKTLSTIAPMITGMQLLQMMGGIIVTITAFKKMQAGEQCAADWANLKLGLAMYVSYFILFFRLFVGKYVTPQSKNKSRDPKLVCGVDVKEADSAGCNFDSGPAKNGNKKHD